MVASSMFVDTSRHIISDSLSEATFNIRSEVGDTMIAPEKVVGLRGEEVIGISDQGVIVFKTGR
jgi:hypothetical protein